MYINEYGKGGGTPPISCITGVEKSSPFAVWKTRGAVFERGRDSFKMSNLR